MTSILCSKVQATIKAFIVKTLLRIKRGLPVVSVSQTAEPTQVLFRSLYCASIKSIFEPKMYSH